MHYCKLIGQGVKVTGKIHPWMYRYNIIQLENEGATAYLWFRMPYHHEIVSFKLRSSFTKMSISISISATLLKCKHTKYRNRGLMEIAQPYIMIVGYCITPCWVAHTPYWSSYHQHKEDKSAGMFPVNYTIVQMSCL